MFASYLLETFTNKSTISVTFHDSTRLALEYMKMANERQVSIKMFRYQTRGEHSSEIISKILDECTEVTDVISIDAFRPDDFVYIPPRPFKTKELYVWKTTNWFNLEEFMSCRWIFLELSDNSNRTAETYNLFFNKWMNLDVRLQALTLYISKESDRRSIMDALKNLFRNPAEIRKKLDRIKTRKRIGILHSCIASKHLYLYQTDVFGRFQKGLATQRQSKWRIQLQVQYP
uniref:FBA_2 domain-containing protein n=1 Tax=Caenorhabditis tropicalis TaxID=1561998 RepID=A0A1I7UTM3_9PELO